MTTESVAASLPPPHRWLRILLIVVAAAEALGTLTSLPGITLFFTEQHPTALLRFAQGLLSVKLALAPFVAVPAFMFALKGRLREATLALAALLLLTWLLDDTTTFAIHGFEFAGGLVGITLFARNFVFPVLALAGGWLAFKDRRPGLAALLVSVPTIFYWVGVAIFTVTIMIYGF
jgi:hypothetical protein